MIAATGESALEGDKPSIYVWNIDTKDILASLSGIHIKSVRHVFLVIILL